MNILDRYKKPTPKFFRILRNWGIALASAGGTILTAPVSLPVWLLTAATYVVVAGTVATAVSQAAVEDSSIRDELQKQRDGS
ncbi:MAG: hypothetical protein WBA61_08815 [Aequorivita sp.]|nr:hypothetical protein [Aequorivita sp.]